VAGTFVVLLAAAALAGAAIAWRGRVPDPVVRFQVRPPLGTELYLASRSDVPFALDAVAIAGTEGALSPFFSPDGRNVGFLTSTGAIRRVGVDGVPVQTIATGPSVTMSAPTWGDDGVVTYLGADNRLHSVSSAGRRSDPVGDQPPRDSARLSLADSVAAYPSPLPGGRSVLVSLCLAGILQGGGTCGSAQLAVLDLTSGQQASLGVQAIRGWYADGYLLFATREGTLLAATFDLDRRAVTSDPVVLLDGLAQTVMAVTPQIDVASAGAMAFLPGRTVAERTIVQVDRHGREEVLIAAPGSYAWARLSPDQTRIAMGKLSDRQIYVYDRRNGTTSPVTSVGANQRPTWSPDGRRVAFISSRQGRTDVWVVRADGAEPARAIAPGKDVVQQAATFWTADGAWIVIDGTADEGSDAVGDADDIFALPASGNGPLRRVIATQASEQTGEVSPDGRWIAYVSDDAGDFQVYVQPFLRPGGRTLVSTGPAIEPAWASNNEITYTSLTTDSLVVATLEFGSSIAVKRTSLFDRGRYAPGAPSWREYDVSHDGQHFLFEKPLSRSERAEPVVVLNWMTEVRQAVAKQARRR